MERELSLSTPHGNLKSILTLPDNERNNPVVILVHGSGPNDMDETVGNNKMFYDLTLGLVDSGIGTFRYNKRTRTYGSKFSDTSTLYSEVIEDVLETVRLLKQQKGVDTNRIYVLGHSLGGMSAPLIAKYQKCLAGIIMMGAPCRGFWEGFPIQYRYLKENTSQPITEDMIVDVQKASIRIAKGEFSDTTNKSELLGLSAAYWEYLRNYDVSKTCKNLDLPIMILQGERDYQVNMDDFNCFKEKLSTQGNIKFVIIPGSNHLFIYGKTKSVPAEYEKPGNVDLKAIQTITNWIKEGL
jgi:dipeptidyl aminopeptidase/acylaminoacyl peptidase